MPIDTEENKKTSLHIFQDWKKYVDNTLYKLEKDGKLFSQEMNEESIQESDRWKITGTDGKTYEYKEYYTDATKETPLIDYSYRKDENGNINYDRWDFWSENDFK